MRTKRDYVADIDEIWDDSVLGNLCAGLLLTMCAPWIFLFGVLTWDYEIMRLDYD